MTTLLLINRNYGAFPLLIKHNNEGNSSIDGFYKKTPIGYHDNPNMAFLF